MGEREKGEGWREGCGEREEKERRKKGGEEGV